MSTPDDDALSITPELEAELDAMIEGAVSDPPDFQEIGEHVYVPVEQGSIRVIHVKPEHPVGVRPVLFIPGWGTFPEEFRNFYAMLHGRVELYYVETREKRSSRITRRGARMDMHRKARDIAAVIEYFCLGKLPDFMVLGTCWGSAILLQGLIDGVIKAPTYVAVDPMHTLWFPKWVLYTVGPFFPIWFVAILRPILKRTMIGDMEEKNQKARTERFIDEAVLWKWKKAAIQTRDFELFGKLGLVKDDVVVVNGTGDKVHEQGDYPRIARELVNGSFLYLKTGESKRERMIGLTALEFAKVSSKEGIPAPLRPFRTV